MKPRTTTTIQALILLTLLSVCALGAGTTLLHNSQLQDNLNANGYAMTNAAPSLGTNGLPLYDPSGAATCGYTALGAISSAQTVTITRTGLCSSVALTLQPGTAAYTVNVILSDAGFRAGDLASINVAWPASTNPTLAVYDNSTSGTPFMSLAGTLNSVTATYDFRFDGTAWHHFAKGEVSQRTLAAGMATSLTNGFGATAITFAQGNDSRFPSAVTGLRKSAGAGSTDVAAVAGTDYVLPSGSITGNAATASAVPLSGVAGLHSTVATAAALPVNSSGALITTSATDTALRLIFQEGTGTTTQSPFTYPVESQIAPATLPRWKAALARVRTKVGNATLLVWGDSTVGGIGTISNSPGPVEAGAKVHSFPWQLGQAINSPSLPASDMSWFDDQSIGSTAYTTLWDPRVVFTGSWAPSARYGIDGVFWDSGSTTGQVIAFAPQLPCDSVDIYTYGNGGTGSYTINVDGGATVSTVNTQSITGNGAQKNTVFFPRGTHTINLTHSAGINIYIEGMVAHDSQTPSINIINCAQPGEVIGVGTGDGTSSGYNPIPQLNAIAPDLVLIDMEINDTSPDGSGNPKTPLATYLASLTTVVQGFQATSDVVLVMPEPLFNSTQNGIMLSWRSSIYAFANANHCSVLDLYNHFGSYANTVTSNFTGLDAGGNASVHMNTQAYNDVANYLASELVESGPASSTIANGTETAPSPLAVGAGTNPWRVFKLPGMPITNWSGIAGVNYPYFFQGSYLLAGSSGGGLAQQSVLVASLPFTPQQSFAWYDMGQRSGLNSGGLIQIGNNGNNSGSQPGSPAGPNNGIASTRFVLTFSASNITCAAGDKLVCCTTAGGTGGSQFTFTADAAVSGSSKVSIRAITQSASGSNEPGPTTSDTVLYDATTSTSYTTTYASNSSTNVASFPHCIIWPATNATTGFMDVYYYGDNATIEPVLTITAF